MINGRILVYNRECSSRCVIGDLVVKFAFTDAVIGLVAIDEVRIVTSLFKRFINFRLHIIILFNFTSIKNN